ncbi:MAG: type II toxin-antitoxin system RelE/ParE family toxin [Spirochaetia bacterium]|jgi:proteic killer suppression protein|nr:type II toxin-antitoxin system RelE/ParE family toxin [Spirochaetia bacterium]
MIQSSKDGDTVKLARGERIARFVSIEVVVRRKLRQLRIAASLDDLRVPPGNRLEALTVDRAGQHSIRMNDRYCICFHWRASIAVEVEIVDCH